MKKKFLSILLVLAMIISIAPVSVFATNQVQWKGSMNYGDANNMVRDLGDKTPVSKDYTVESWYTVADSKGYPSTQVIIGDYIYCYNGKLVKYDLNGTKVSESEEFGTPNSWGYYEYLTATDDGEYIFVTFSGKSKDYVIKTSDLSVALETEKLDNSTYPAAQYHNGFLFCNGSIYKFETSPEVKLTLVGTKIGTRTVQQTIGETSKDVAFSMTITWSSGAFIKHGNPQTEWFYVVGYDNNKEKKSQGKVTQYASEAYNNEIVYAVDYTTGEIKATLNVTNSNIAAHTTSGQLVYDEDTGYVYWGSYTSKLYAVKIKSDGTFDESTLCSVDLNQTSVCAPVIANKRAYFAGNSGYINVIDVDPESANFMKLIYTSSNSIFKIQSNPITFVDASDNVYVYIQSYVASGHLYCLKDTKTSTEGTLELIATPSQGISYDAETFSGSQGGAFAFEQMCTDSSGRIYLVNDSGLLYCYEKAPVKVPSITSNLSTEYVKYNMLATESDIAPLTVAAESQDGGVITYQWQKSSDSITWSNIADATTGSYTPIKEIGNYFYRCKVTNTKGQECATVYSANANIEVKNYSSDKTLQYILTSGNGVSGSKVALSDNQVFFLQTTELKYRVWLDAPENGSIAVTQVAGKDVFATANNQSGFEYRCYCSAGVTEINKFKIEITSEDGSTDTKYLYIAPKTCESSGMNVSVRATAQKDGMFVYASESAISVSSKAAETYGYTDGISYLDGVSALDVLVTVHQKIYGSSFTAESKDSYLVVSNGNISKFFGETTGNCGFTVNKGHPNDGILGQWGYGGLSINQASVNNNDELEFFIYQDGYAADIYTYLSTPNTIKANTPFEVDVTGICYGWSASYYKTPAEMKAAATTVAGISIGAINLQTSTITDLNSVTDENGVAQIILTPAGIYYLSAYGTDDNDTPVIMALTKAVVDDHLHVDDNKDCYCDYCNELYKTPKLATVNFTVQTGGAFIYASNSGIEVKSNVAETFGYVDSVDSTESVSALDVLVTAHQKIYGSNFTVENKDAYLVVSNGNISKIFGEETYNCGFTINKGYPNDGVLGQYGYGGLAINQAIVNTNDELEFFIYQDGWASDTYTYLSIPSSLKVNNAFDVAVTGICYGWNGSNYKTPAEMKAAATTVAGISIGAINLQTKVITDLGVSTNANGIANVTIANAGTYYLVAYGTDDNDTPVIMTLGKAVVSSVNPITPPVDTKISVYYTVLGDTSHGSSGTTHTLRNGGLTTWVAQRVVKVAKNSTVWDVMQQAATDLGGTISYNNPDGNYVASITYNGTTIGEYTNGQLSGWMYTLNGTHPNIGVSAQTVSDGDSIVFHYTDDYTKEQGSEEWGGSSSGSGSSTTNTKTETTKEITSVNGKAELKMEAATLEKAITKDATSIEVKAEVKGDANEVKVELPTESLKKISEETKATVDVKTPNGNVAMPTDALKEIVKQAGGKDIAINVETKDVKDVSSSITANVPDVKLDGAVAVEFNIKAGDKAITDFGGTTVNVSIPVDTAKFTDGKLYKSVIVSSDKSVETGTAKIEGGNAVVGMMHFSTVVITTEEVSPFSDVDPSAWYAEAITKAYAKGLVGGTGADKFEPTAKFSRAMLAVLLYNLDGKKTVTTKHPFVDASAEWYQNALSWAYTNKIVGGVDATHFSPDASITREEMAAMLYNYAKFKMIRTTNSNTLAGFTDAKNISSWALDAFKWANYKEVIKGSDGKLSPKATATRAEAAALLVNFVEKVEE